jgi:hypothetical protein
MIYDLKVIINQLNYWPIYDKKDHHFIFIIVVRIKEY